MSNPGGVYVPPQLQLGFTEPWGECTCDQWSDGLPHWHMGALTEDDA